MDIDVNDSSTGEDQDRTDQDRDEENIQSAMQGGRQSKDYEYVVEAVILTDEDH